MRIFVAMPLPEGTVEEMKPWLGRQRRSWPDLRWVRDQQLHLTVRFLGDITDAALDELLRLLGATPFEESPFVIDDTGSFGQRVPGGLPSVYWISGSFGSQVGRMAELLSRVPDDRGRVDRRSFRPHITIARQGTSGSRATLDPPGPWSGVLSRTVVYNSTLTREGPVYEAVRTYGPGAQKGGLA
ncbi:RNA 2',3'-cyclic phosphodiesterase [Candidatus Fermentibacterales bacterium]|nr:RNA 2',3'-cyclic phosphodiesterase [Candidatus Fermentibacterales bacterium]